MILGLGTEVLVVMVVVLTDVHVKCKRALVQSPMRNLCPASERYARFILEVVLRQVSPGSTSKNSRCTNAADKGQVLESEL